MKTYSYHLLEEWHRYWLSIVFIIITGVLRNYRTLKREMTFSLFMLQSYNCKKHCSHGVWSRVWCVDRLKLTRIGKLFWRFVRNKTPNSFADVLKTAGKVVFYTSLLTSSAWVKAWGVTSASRTVLIRVRLIIHIHYEGLKTKFGF